VNPHTAPLPAGLRIRPDRGSVQASLWLGGRRYQRTVARLDELAAQPPDALESFLLARIDAAEKALAAEAPARRSQPGRVRFSVLWQEFVDAAAATRRTGTLAHYARTGNAFLAACGDPPVRSLSPRHVDRLLSYLRTPPARPSVATVNIRLQNLATFLRWAAERGEIDRPPRIRQLRRERKLPRVPSDDQVRAWLRLLQRIARWRRGDPSLVLPDGRRLHPGSIMRLAARRREWFVRIAQDTGLRLAEWVHTPLSAYDTERGLLTVRYQPRLAIKEGREKVIPLTRRARRLVRALRAVHPAWTYFIDDGRGILATASADLLSDRLAWDLRALGLAHHGFKPAHCFRALFAHRLRERGVDRVTIRDLMGHSDIKVTDAYLPVSHTPARVAIAALEHDLSPRV